MPDLSARDQARLFRLGGRATAETAGPYAGLKLLELALHLALKAKDWDCLGGTRVELGVYWLMVGDIPNAIEYLKSYLLDLERYTSAKGYLGHVHYNLGLAHRRRGDLAAAVSHYEAAVEWFTEKGYTLQAGATHQNLCWLYCLGGQHEEATRELELAESFGEVCGQGFRVEQLVCRALLYRVQGSLGEATKMAEEVLQPGRQGATPAHKGNAAWIVSTIALEVRHYPNAKYFADLAITYALEAKDTAIMSQANKVKAEIARRQGLGEEAAN